MNSKRSRVSSALRATGLGVLAALAAACADGSTYDSNQAGENTGNAKAKITGLGWSPSGCGGKGAFDVSSGQNESLNFIAVDRSDLRSLDSNISIVDSNSRETLLDETAVEADERFQSMFDTETKFLNAAETASLIESEQKSVAERSVLTEVEQSSTVQTVTNTRSSGSANNVVESFSNHRDSSFASDNNFANRSAFGSNRADGFKGGIGNSFANRSFLSSGSLINANNASTDFDRTSTHSDFTNSTHTDSLISTSSFLRTFLDERTASASFASEQQKLNSLSQATAQAATKQSTRAQSRASTFVFRDLSRFNSNRIILRVQAEANQKQSSSLLRVFAGNQFGVTGWGDFDLSFPGCGDVGMIDP